MFIYVIDVKYLQLSTVSHCRALAIYQKLNGLFLLTSCDE